MKTRMVLFVGALLLSIFTANIQAQGTAFTYQGQLSSSNSPANGHYDFTFTLLDPNSQPAPDMALYMGMPGHAAFVKTDGSVFAHIHPSGSASMAALMLAQAQNNQTPINQTQSNQAPGAQPPAQSDMTSMPGMNMSGGNALPNTVSFPYGFPTAGTYRIVVQMKHGNTVETGFFDVEVGAPLKKTQ